MPVSRVLTGFRPGRGARSASQTIQSNSLKGVGGGSTAPPWRGITPCPSASTRSPGLLRRYSRQVHVVYASTYQPKGL